MNVIDVNTNEMKGTGFQIFVAVIANLIAVTDGMTMGWTSPMIPYFLSDKTHIKMTQNEAESLETFLLLGAVAGLPITMIFVDLIGRKRSMLLSCCILIVCWLVIGFINILWFIYAARFVQGLGLNMAFVAMPMYVGEIAHKQIRGSLSAVTFMFMLIGLVCVYSIGRYLPYFSSPIVAIVLLIVELSVLPFLPETPYYLLVKNRREEAKRALKLFRGGSDIDNEFQELLEVTKKTKTEKGRLQDIVLVSNNRKAAMIMIVLNFTQLFGSFEVIMMNLHEILDSAGSLFMDPSIVAIIFAVLMLVSCFFATLIVDKFGRKKLLIISCILTTLCVLTLAIYFHLRVLQYDLNNVSWIPIAAVMAYALSFKFGLGTVPIVITAEIFSQKMKAIGMTMADGVYVVASLAALQIFFTLRDLYGMHAPFYIFSCCLLLALPYLIFCIPETKGKSLDEIQDILREQKCTFM